MVKVIFDMVLPVEVLEPIFWQTVTTQTVQEVQRLRERVRVLEAAVGKLVLAIGAVQAGPGGGKIITPGPGGGFVKPPGG